ncbi:MAG: phosphoribosylformimino-5-aminoimidazole carboxamide ribotide isomerase [Capsulimonadaceae bacterium]
MAFRPCIDLRQGRVVQIVGGTLTDDGADTITNFVTSQTAADFASMYARDGLLGGHVIMLGSGNEEAAKSALAAYPGGLQVGGGITPQNAAAFIESGASHIIVTSYLFPNGELSFPRARELAALVGKERIVIDLSCRRMRNGSYRVATNRWQTVSDTGLSAKLFANLGLFCDEFLIHAADVEGKSEGIDEELVELLGGWIDRPATYAGGAKSLCDITRVEELSGGKLDLTIGSALDIFGGDGVLYAEAAALGRRAVPPSGEVAGAQTAHPPSDSQPSA